MTLRELLWAVEGRRRVETGDNAAVLAVLCNLPAAVWGKKGRAKPSDFDPYATRGSSDEAWARLPKIGKGGGFEALKAFVPEQKKKG